MSRTTRKHSKKRAKRTKLTAEEESERKWAEMLKGWQENPSSIPSVRDSHWNGAKYCGCLADYPGDKSAVVSSAHEAKEVAKKKGLIGPGSTVEVRS